MMANLAIGLKSCPHVKTNQKQKYYLRIPYSEKEVGKKYGAKWDPKKKKWYYEGLNTFYIRSIPRWSNKT